LFSKIQNVEEYDWLVACSCISDWLPLKPAQWLSVILIKYGDKLVIDGEGIRKSGFFWGLQYKLSLVLVYFRNEIQKAYELIDGKSIHDESIEKYARIVRKEIEQNIILFRDKAISIKDGYYFEPKSKFKVSEMIINELSWRENNKTFVFSTTDGEITKVSARRQDGIVDLPMFLKKLVEGFERSSAGGHIKAAGGNFPARYLAEFKKRLGIS
jgi:nanoRNase/pAp phosphatase (c-di-AMP/oligoRNAs hydrolase)